MSYGGRSIAGGAAAARLHLSRHEIGEVCVASAAQSRFIFLKDRFLAPVALFAPLPAVGIAQEGLDIFTDILGVVVLRLKRAAPVRFRTCCTACWRYRG